MRAYLCLAIACLLLGAVPARAEKLDFSKDDPEATAAAEKAWASSIAEAKDAGSPSSLKAIKLDLNGDGKSEIVGELKSAYLCGTNGPCFFVMADLGGGIDIIFSTPGVENVEVLTSKTKGWLDIKINDDDTYRYVGGTYRAQ